MEVNHMNLDDFKNVEEVFGFEGSYNKHDIDLSGYSQLSINDKEVGSTFTGIPSCLRLQPREDKNYTSIGLRIVDEENMEVLDCYANVPLDYPILEQPIRRSNNFLRTSFDFIMSTMKVLNPESVLTSNGDEKNIINAGVNLEKIIELYNALDEVTVEIVELDDYYNSFIVTDMK